MRRWWLLGEPYMVPCCASDCYDCFTTDEQACARWYDINDCTCDDEQLFHFAATSVWDVDLHPCVTLKGSAGRERGGGGFWGKHPIETRTLLEMSSILDLHCANHWTSWSHASWKQVGVHKHIRARVKMTHQVSPPKHNTKHNVLLSQTGTGVNFLLRSTV